MSAGIGAFLRQAGAALERIGTGFQGEFAVIEPCKHLKYFRFARTYVFFPRLVWFLFSLIGHNT